MSASLNAVLERLRAACPHSTDDMLSAVALAVDGGDCTLAEGCAALAEMAAAAAPDSPNATAARRDAPAHTQRRKTPSPSPGHSPATRPAGAVGGSRVPTLPPVASAGRRSPGLGGGLAPPSSTAKSASPVIGKSPAGARPLAAATLKPVSTGLQASTAPAAAAVKAPATARPSATVSASVQPQPPSGAGAAPRRHSTGSALTGSSTTAPAAGNRDGAGAAAEPHCRSRSSTVVSATARVPIARHASRKSLRTDTSGGTPRGAAAAGSEAQQQRQPRSARAPAAAQFGGQAPGGAGCNPADVWPANRRGVQSPTAAGRRALLEAATVMESSAASALIPRVDGASGAKGRAPPTPVVKATGASPANKDATPTKAAVAAKTSPAAAARPAPPASPPPSDRPRSRPASPLVGKPGASPSTHPTAPHSITGATPSVSPDKAPGSDAKATVKPPVGGTNAATAAAPLQGMTDEAAAALGFVATGAFCDPPSPAADAKTGLTGAAGPTGAAAAARRPSRLSPRPASGGLGARRASEVAVRVVREANDDAIDKEGSMIGYHPGLDQKSKRVARSPAVGGGSPGPDNSTIGDRRSTGVGAGSRRQSNFLALPGTGDGGALSTSARRASGGGLSASAVAAAAGGDAAANAPAQQQQPFERRRSSCIKPAAAREWVTATPSYAGAAVAGSAAVRMFYDPNTQNGAAMSNNFVMQGVLAKLCIPHTVVDVGTNPFALRRAMEGAVRAAKEGKVKPPSSTVAAPLLFVGERLVGTAADVRTRADAKELIADMAALGYKHPQLTSDGASGGMEGNGRILLNAVDHAKAQGQFGSAFAPTDATANAPRRSTGGGLARDGPDSIPRDARVVLFTTTITAHRRIRDDCRAFEHQLYLHRVPHEIIDVAQNQFLRKRLQEEGLLGPNAKNRVTTKRPEGADEDEESESKLFSDSKHLEELGLPALYFADRLVCHAGELQDVVDEGRLVKRLAAAGYVHRPTELPKAPEVQYQEHRDRVEQDLSEDDEDDSCASLEKYWGKRPKQTDVEVA